MNGTHSQSTWQQQPCATHNGACVTNYRANWDLCNMAAVFAIGAFTDDPAKIDQAVNYFHNGGGNGSIRRAVNFLHEGGTIGQWEESGRDQAHTMGGVGWMAVLCEMQRIRPENGGGYRGPNSGGFDHFGFGTLTHTAAGVAAPMVSGGIYKADL